MERIETVEFTNMCMICDGSRVVVMEREKRDWPGVTFPGGAGENQTDYPFPPALRHQGLV